MRRCTGASPSYATPSEPTADARRCQMRLPQRPRSRASLLHPPRKRRPRMMPRRRLPTRLRRAALQAVQTTRTLVKPRLGALNWRTAMSTSGWAAAGGARGWMEKMMAPGRQVQMQIMRQLARSRTHVPRRRLGAPASWTWMVKPMSGRGCVVTVTPRWPTTVCATMPCTVGRALTMKVSRAWWMTPPRARGALSRSGRMLPPPALEVGLARTAPCVRATCVEALSSARWT
mmetsp:Transcript_14281/g.43400  ORF Transcript_14281/g.43400 Transcript_14281/m.43400 type:complete len:231 (+) Transcript_14281:1646-2338(+)